MRIGSVTIDHSDDPVLNTHGYAEHRDQSFLFSQLFFFVKRFFEDIEALGIKPASEYPKATAHIPEMVALIKKLLAKGIAYKADDGCIYYSISKFKNYGKLANTNLEQLQEGASGRMLKDEYAKEQARDFALWKAWTAEDGDVFWETEIGKGRPGWHIECSAMSSKYLGLPLIFMVVEWTFVFHIMKMKLPNPKRPPESPSFATGSTTVSSILIRKKCPNPWGTFCPSGTCSRSITPRLFVSFSFPATIAVLWTFHLSTWPRPMPTWTVFIRPCWPSRSFCPFPSMSPLKEIRVSFSASGVYYRWAKARITPGTPSTSVPSR
jgi:hypothetical protein